MKENKILIKFAQVITELKRNNYNAALKLLEKLNINEDENFYLLKEFKFENFVNAQDFVNKVAAIAESEGHHPDIWFGWRYAKIKIFTHAINGLAESDFILAAKIDKIN